MSEAKPLALTIAGFDPSSGAGLQVDLKVFEELNVYGLSVATAITAQNSQAVLDVYTPPTNILKAQIETVLNDIHPMAIKIGMLSDKNNIMVLKEQLLKLDKKQVVVDPIFTSTSGMALLDNEGQKALTHAIFPLTLVLTPNIEEAEKLAGFGINSLDDAQRAASVINDLGPKWVVIKGAHRELDANLVQDVVYDGVSFTILKKERIDKKVRGTGCIFSAAITAYLANGLDELEAIKKARDFVQAKIKEASMIGTGNPQI